MSEFDELAQYPDGNLAYYQEELLKVEAELEELQSNIDLSDKILSLREHPGWQAVRDRVRTLKESAIVALTKMSPNPYLQGKLQARVALADVVLTDRPLSQGDIDKAQQRITLLREQIRRYQEILR